MLSWRWWLYIGHRWLGIVTCLLAAMWFVSGVVMMYVPYPSLERPEKLALLSPIAWDKVHVAPNDALSRAGLSAFPSDFRLEMLLDEPVYRMVDGPFRRTISAADGHIVEGVSPEQAVAIVAQAKPGAHPLREATLSRDQWTVPQSYDFARPIYKVALNDDAGSVIYVSSTTGDMLLDTHRSERFWNYLGSVPHWIYPASLRKFPQSWRQVILWTSGISVIGIITGLWIGILRIRIKRRFSRNRMTPYSGWMKWHHVGGLIGGVFMLTWMFSGWLSVNPLQLFDRAPPDPLALVRYAGHEGVSYAGDAVALAALGASNTGAVEARFLWWKGEALALLTDAKGERSLFNAPGATKRVLTDGEIFAQAASLMPEAKIASATRLISEDAYWYSHHHHRDLPMLRVKFDDANQTWFHIDPLTAQITGRVDASGREYRWMFNAIHDFDLQAFTGNRTMWDIVVWILSLAGMVISVSAVVIGWRHLVGGKKTKSAREKSAKAKARERRALEAETV